MYFGAPAPAMEKQKCDKDVANGIQYNCFWQPYTPPRVYQVNVEIHIEVNFLEASYVLWNSKNILNGAWKHKELLAEL